jgi:hypothetical protein
MPSGALQIHNFLNCANFLNLHVGLEYYSQLSQLCQLEVPNRIYFKYPGIDSIFEFLMNFKGVQTFWEKSDKFSKILS